MNDLDLEAAAQTVIDIADHMQRLRESAEHFHATYGTRDRGFFIPVEDDAVAALWVSYHKARIALFEVIASIRGEIDEPSEEAFQEFVIAYAAGVILVDAARGLRDLFGDDEIVRRIQRGSHDGQW